MDINAYEQKVKRLEFQNKRLSEKVEVQKSEAAEREKTIAEQSSRWTAAQCAVLAVRRGWTQLHEDLKDCANRMGLQLEPTQIPTPLPFLDPIVEALLTPIKDTAVIDDVRTNVQAMTSLAEDTDIDIKRMTEDTMRVFVQLMDRLPVPAEDVHETEGDWMALKRVLNERVRLAEDKLLRRETELQDVRNLLADCQIELENAQRKILSYKNDPVRQESSTARSTGEPSKTMKSEDVSKRTDNNEASLKALHQTCIDSLIQSKIEELEKERTERIRLQKQLRTMELEIKSEEWVHTTQLYKTMMNRHDQYLHDLDRKTRENAALQQALELKEKELTKKRRYDPESAVQNYESLKGLQKKLGELQMLMSKADPLRNETEAAIGVLQGSTIEEFNQLLKNAQNDSMRLRKRLKESVDDGDRVEIARKESIEAAKRMRTAESGMEHLKERVQELEDSKQQLTRREEQLIQTKEDLKVFIEVLSTIEGVEKNWKESEFKAREQNILRENASLKRKIEDAEGRKSKDEISSKELHSCKRKIEKLTIRLDRTSKELEEITRVHKHNEDDLCQQKQLNSALEEELEQTGAAYEEMQAQSGRLVEQVAAKDAVIVDLKHQITKSTQRINVLTSLVENLEASAAVNESNSQQLDSIRGAFEGHISELHEEINSLKSQIAQLEDAVQKLHGDMIQKEGEIQELQYRLEAEQRKVEEYKRAAEDEVEKHLHERTKRQRLEADVKAFEDLKKKVRTGSATLSDFTDEQDIAILNQENESLRQALKCSVCQTRYKSVILTKCMHTFCKTCIDNRIETRSRRCPGCGSTFSREEVRQFYLS